MNIEHKLRTTEQMDYEKPEPPDHLRYAAMGRTLRKHVSEKYCGGENCLPGLGGKCTACSEDD